MKDTPPTTAPVASAALSVKARSFRNCLTVTCMPPLQRRLRRPRGRHRGEARINGGEPRAARICPPFARGVPRIVRAMARTVAIVEDDAAIRANYADMLKKHGYQVSTCADRKSAAAGFRTRLPDLALLDIGLADEPDGGFTLCRELRALSAALPIIFLTARDSDFDMVSGLDRKSTRLNSSHLVISYAVFCLKKKNID